MRVDFSAQPVRLYSDLAWLWPIISPPEDYVVEAMEFASLIRKYIRVEEGDFGSGRSQPEDKPKKNARVSNQRQLSLVNLGCGGGHLDKTLKKYFKVTGVDLSHQMLRLAGRLNPEVTYVQGDMRNVPLSGAFDAVMAADSIDYMLTEADLSLAFQNAYKLLKPGGTFITYVEQSYERFENNQTDHSTHTQVNLEVTLVENLFDPDPSDTTYEATLLYLIRRKDPDGSAEPLGIEIEQHRLGIFSLLTWRNLLEAAGFEVYQEEFPEDGFPFFISAK